VQEVCLTIPRSCIDLETVGYNGERSQELRLHERAPVGAEVARGIPDGRVLDVSAYLPTAVIQDGVLDPRHANPVNAAR
jgi:hypothetical protein